MSEKSIEFRKDDLWYGYEPLPTPGEEHGFESEEHQSTEVLSMTYEPQPITSKFVNQEEGEK